MGGPSYSGLGPHVAVRCMKDFGYKTLPGRGKASGCAICGRMRSTDHVRTVWVTVEEQREISAFGSKDRIKAAERITGKAVLVPQIEQPSMKEF